MPLMSSNPHPGLYIRDYIIPKSVSVKEAAELLGVGRPALSNLLNGNASLSADMAAKIERTFEASASELLAMQSTYDAAQAHSSRAAESARAFVPPFLQAKANDIEAWADKISSRSRMPVFLRILVHSTGRDSRKVDFPGNDDSERPGWDGIVEMMSGNPWIPVGRSGWEFGTNKSPGPKASSDFSKSVKAVPKSERSDMTFVFVTPRRWAGKDHWRKDRLAEGEWKDVRVYDSSDLEQWLEQSIPAQVWFAGEQGKRFRGTRSLETCWINWNADCEPRFTCQAFAEAILTAGKRILDRIKKSPERAIKIASDSREEAFAFLNCLFSAEDAFTADLRDRAIVFEEVGPLSELASKSSNFIPIIADKAVEKELSQLGLKIGSIIIYPRSVIGAEADVVLEPISYQAFHNALETMGLGRDEIDRLSRESGRSLTVLRRRLSQSLAIRRPDWSEDEELASSLVPFMLAGAWKANNEVDCYMLRHLANIDSYEDLEKRFLRLLSLEHSPVWSIGNFKGLVSKIDAFYAVHSHVNTFHLERFYEVANLVLSELESALELPEDQRWAAGMYGKTRDVSAALREGICETVVLLAIHGKALLGVDTQSRADRLIRGLLEPADAKALESHSSDLPLYAEASPEEFLRILENDLRKPEPQILSLMRPSPNPMFGTSPRVGLLWALENLAWSPRYISRVVDILAQLAEAKLDDNLANKPDATLKSIFRSWMPQTGAGLEDRIALLERLVRQHPDIAWPICLNQFEARRGYGHYNHRPRWRDFAFGFGEPTNVERIPFEIRAMELALDWPAHNWHTLADFMENIQGIPDHQDQVWNVVEAWGETASDEDRAWLREKIRVNTMTRRAKRGKGKGSRTGSERARQLYDKLEPRDLIQKHAWLFREHCVEESLADLEQDVDLEKREKHIEQERLSALDEIYRQLGLEGILRIALSGNAAFIVGNLSGALIEDSAERLRLAERVLADGAIATSVPHKALVAGLFARIGHEAVFALVDRLLPEKPFEEIIHLLKLMPFEGETWAGISRLGAIYEDRYWQVADGNGAPEKKDIDYAVRRLLEANRPRAAFALARFAFKHIDPELLFRILERLPSSEEEQWKFGRLEAHYVKKALEHLDDTKMFTVDQMATLEFVNLDLFRYEKGGIPNVERQIGENPGLFVEAISYLYKRDDGSFEESESPSEVVQRAAEKAYHLLEKLSRVPGHDDYGELSAERLAAWVDEVRKRGAEVGQAAVCDLYIGKLLSRAPADENDVWPCKPVREVLDQVLTDEMKDGLITGIYNSRGVHWRDEGGQQERALAEKYEGWARTQEYTYPRVAAALRELAERYRRDADWQDNEAGIRKRLLY